MKTLGLVLAMLVLCGGVSIADTLAVTVDTYAGWSLMAAPIVPLNPDPLTLFPGPDYDLYFTTGLFRWDAPNANMLAYDPWESPPGATFGNILLGDGYWLTNPTAGKVKYTGVADGVPDSVGNMTDMWVSLPGLQGPEGDTGGWHLIGSPFNHNTPVDNGGLDGHNIRFTDGTTTVNWSGAVAAGWVADTMFYWDGVAQSMYDCGYFFNTDDQIRAKYGYWIETKVDNVAMIVPATTPVP